MKIKAAAILQEDGSIYSLPKPHRHPDIIIDMASKGLRYGGQQGFILDNGEFVNRVEALKIAKAADQVIRKDDLTNQLYTEDLW